MLNTIIRWSAVRFRWKCLVTGIQAEMDQWMSIVGGHRQKGGININTLTDTHSHTITDTH